MCVKNKTLLKYQIIYINIITRFELEREQREIEINKKLDANLNKTDLNVNKSEQILKETNSSKEILGKINSTTQQTKGTLTKSQQSQNCKEKVGLIPEILGLILAAILAIIAEINKKNKKLRKLFWILAGITILLIIITRIGIVFLIC